MRGEDIARRSLNLSKPGSPPHARGRLNGEYDVHIAGRITPACAGKTDHVDLKCKNCQDHPRMRGED